MPRGRRRFLAALRDPTREQMWDIVQHVIGRSASLMYRFGRDEFFERTAPQLAAEFMGLLDSYAETYHAENSRWQERPPADSGYYLAAWRNGRDWTVSELWYNPSSIGTGWWQSRIYLHQEDHSGQPVEVVAWMPKPVFKPPKEQ